MKFSKLFKSAALTSGALIVAKGLDNRLETTHYTITSDKIPEEFDGFRIVQISDLHASAVPGLVAEVKKEEPDIIVFTGDLVHDRGSYNPGIILAKKLALIADVYFVTGNHDLRRSDYKEFQDSLDKTGTITLHNESAVLKRDNAVIILSGIEDPISEEKNTITDRIKASIKKIEKTDNYHIVLFHRANHMDSLLNEGFDLIISGHMHGGQVRLPNGRGVCSPKSSWGSGSPMLFPKYFAGHYAKSGTDMIVSRGIGNPMIIPRLFNRPEMIVITLHSAKK